MDVDEFEPPKKRERQAGAKGYNKHTLYKILSQLKQTNMLLCRVVAEQYRVQCGEGRLLLSRSFLFKSYAIICANRLHLPASTILLRNVNY